ncbi:hypothetical protein [Erythrobacter tepidarius]|uniref:hypothetical protein n=1 Tax=Erythrobacter tepidarius TaxID=60454 RepID=UPI000A3A08E2|nr:hypothetical protein [Erythrobacter tepidarius]
MSGADRDEGAPIVPGSPLARALDGYVVPGLSAGFADKVLAAAANRPPLLPELRRNDVTGTARGWRLGRRIAIGVAGFCALASAAAATGLLERVGLPVPSAGKVWASITGDEPASAPAKPVVAVAAAPVDPAPAALAPVRIEGLIDTPEELAEAFRRIDEVRKGRSELRRRLLDERIALEKERRAAAGLPLPTPEQEARIRQRLEDARLRRERMLNERIEARREELRERVESGEALTREDIMRPIHQEQRSLQQRVKLERLRQMSPEARREALRQLPPEQRRALKEAWQQQRAQRLGREAPLAGEAPVEAMPEARVQPEVSPSETPPDGPPR